MADIIYGINRGDVEEDVTIGASSPSQDIEVVVDDAVGLTKTEVIQHLDMIKNRILKGDDY